MVTLLYIILLFFIIILLIYFSGWFSSMEIALTKISIHQIADMKRKREKGAGYIVKLKNDLDKALVTILLWNNLVNITLSAISTLIANAFFKTVGVSIMIGVLTFILLVFGEITPKAYAVANSKRRLQRSARSLFYLMRLCNPLISIFIRLSESLMKIRGIKIKKESNLLTDEDMKGIANLAEEEGLIKEIERRIINKTFRFGDKKINEVMVPMKEVFKLQEGLSIEEVRSKIVRKGFTRVPIIDKKRKVIGTISGIDLIQRRKKKISSVLRKPYIVSYKRDMTSVFEAMKRRKIHMAIVKKGSIHIGIVTIDDILDELVGTIHDK